MIFGVVFMSDKKKLIKSVFIGSLSGVLGCVVLMCVFAVIMMTSGLLGSGLTEYIMIAVAALGALAGGFVSAKLNRGAGLVVGAITGGVMFILITIAGLSKGSESVTALTGIRAAAVILGGIAGGICGVKEKKAF